MKNIKVETTNRGFGVGKFKDSYNNECSIQESSAATDYYIWLGIDKPKITVFEGESRGKYHEMDVPKTWMVESRMHLSREQVKNLLPLLQKFVETGEL